MSLYVTRAGVVHATVYGKFPCGLKTRGYGITLTFDWGQKPCSVCKEASA